MSEVPGSYFAYPHPQVTSRINFSLIFCPPPAGPKVGMQINWDLRSPTSSPSSVASPLATNPLTPPPSNPPTVGPSALPTAGPLSARAGCSRVVIIPKPVGEPGRPGSGGFNLEDILQNTYNWTKKDVETLLVRVYSYVSRYLFLISYSILQAYIHREATRTLRLDTSYCSQNQTLINKICEMAMDADHWPVLTNYDNCWPVRSALKLILKYKSEALRQVEGKRVAACIRDVIDNREKSHEPSSSDEV
ncbi:hypothetical protein CVT25_002829 [Psilocybe cyanescens]|uniref:Uncharacterized protein n=1 Tax=Psilocybe cyanescens TaxID=93625 RepID=A0A409XWE6_PSICY|nr:hypothetical protein CVT25_002829 [Psilocybe cyanescens]